jgi:hypothetical protein
MMNQDESGRTHAGAGCGKMNNSGSQMSATVKGDVSSTYAGRFKEPAKLATACSLMRPSWGKAIEKMVLEPARAGDSGLELEAEWITGTCLNKILVRWFDRKSAVACSRRL